MTCQCCNAEPSVGVAAVPGIPMSIAWGVKCLEAGVVPYDLLVINTAMCGGREHSADWWQDVVNRTTEYFEVDLHQFDAEVTVEIEKLNETEEDE